MSAKFFECFPDFRIIVQPFQGDHLHASFNRGVNARRLALSPARKMLIRAAKQAHQCSAKNRQLLKTFAP